MHYSFVIDVTNLYLLLLSASSSKKEGKYTVWYSQISCKKKPYQVNVSLLVQSCLLSLSTFLLAFDLQNVLEWVVKFIHVCAWVLNCILGSDPDQHTKMNFTVLHNTSRSFVINRMETGVLQVLERVARCALHTVAFSVRAYI